MPSHDGVPSHPSYRIAPYLDDVPPGVVDDGRAAQVVVLWGLNEQRDSQAGIVRGTLHSLRAYWQGHEPRKSKNQLHGSYGAVARVTRKWMGNKRRMRVNQGAVERIAYE